eukprot:CAMPEP_0171195376 /NCGR_PEP_ID=MMETSP0790-20130122/21366_1 /TAXON_ID=2925 /ORGANISM="Alexandrium catenella, Strain OF101" /LENGTH=520 /DNA_ID=CAMNT_0011660589 /DNA_START=142 /DNA_END=1700 /DNA_ORIENTATION=-
MWRAAASLSILTVVSGVPQAFAADGGTGAQQRPYLACQGSEVIPAVSWAHTKVLATTWADLDLSHARVLRKLFWAIMHNDMLEEHAVDCGFGLAVVMLVALRAIDYDDGQSEAQPAFRYLQGLLSRLEPHRAEAAAAGWDIDTTDLVIYPRVLGLEPPHRCHGTGLRIFVYDIGDMTRGPLHCQHEGAGGLGAAVDPPGVLPHCGSRGGGLLPRALAHVVRPHGLPHEPDEARDLQGLPRPPEPPRGAAAPLARKQGTDHVFLFSDQGMNFFPEYRDHIPHSIFLVTEALTPECGPSCFSPWKDIVLPGHTDFFRYRRMRALNRPSGERDILFNFHGRYPGLCHLYRDNFVRGRIMEVFFGKPRVSVGGFVEDYFEIMGRSHFCLVPMGTSSWTNHLYEAFFAGCIPVIVSDGFRVPFESFLRWPDFSVKWPMGNISTELYEFLDGIPPEQLLEMKRAVDAHACWFDYHMILEPPDGACSPYLGLVRDLERRKGVPPAKSTRRLLAARRAEARLEGAGAA